MINVSIHKNNMIEIYINRERGGKDRVSEIMKR